MLPRIRLVQLERTSIYISFVCFALRVCGFLLACSQLRFYVSVVHIYLFNFYQKRLDKCILFNLCAPRLFHILFVFVSFLLRFQVSYQLKILTTAIFAVIILRKKLLVTQWGSLLFLIAGVAMVQLAKNDQSGGAANANSAADQNRLLGFSAVMGACVLSGFAGIFFEKILKGADISVWMRNVQMSLLSIPLGIIPCFFNDGHKIAEKGFFHGYDYYVMYLVALNACGGLLVAMVVKYADNILKGFATSLAIIITSVVSIFVFDFHLTIQFSVGALLVIVAIFMYGYTPKSKSKPETKISNRNLDQIDVEKEKEKIDDDDESAKPLNAKE